MAGLETGPVLGKVWFLELHRGSSFFMAALKKHFKVERSSDVPAPGLGAAERDIGQSPVDVS